MNSPKGMCWKLVPEYRSTIKEASWLHKVSSIQPFYIWQVQEWHLSCWSHWVQNVCKNLLSLFRQDSVSRITLFCYSLCIWGWRGGGGGRGGKNIFLVLTVPFAPFPNRLAGCPGGLIWCHGALVLLSISKMKRASLLTLAQQRD